MRPQAKECRWWAKKLVASLPTPPCLPSTPPWNCKHHSSVDLGNGAGTLTILYGKAVDQRQAIEPVVVAALAHGVHPWPISEQRPLQPGWDLACERKNSDSWPSAGWTMFCCPMDSKFKYEVSRLGEIQPEIL